MNDVRRSLLTALLCSATGNVFGAAASGKKPAMRPMTSASVFQTFISERGLSTARMSPRQLVAVTLEFYRDVPAAGLDSSDSSDMLLYQWGVVNWGKGEFFEFDITRQFTETGTSGDDGMSQLRLTACFPPTQALRAIKMSNRWCESKRDLAAFNAFIAASEAFKALENVIPARVELRWSKV